MDTSTRNKVFMENEDLIQHVMERDYPLMQATGLEWDDVYQELVVAALNAINTFDPLRSGAIRAHIWTKLQYAALDIERRYKPYGMTAAARPRPRVCPVELSELMGCTPAASTHDAEDDIRERRFRQALTRLEPREREVVVLYLDGLCPKQKTQQNEIAAALEKLKGIPAAAVDRQQTASAPQLDDMEVPTEPQVGPRPIARRLHLQKLLKRPGKPKLHHFTPHEIVTLSTR